MECWSIVGYLQHFVNLDPRLSLLLFNLMTRKEKEEEHGIEVGILLGICSSNSLVVYTHNAHPRL